MERSNDVEKYGNYWQNLLQNKKQNFHHLEYSKRHISQN